MLILINNHKLSNYIANQGASHNAMLPSVSNAQGLPLTKTINRCHSIDAKEVPLVGQIKDAHVASIAHLAKILKLTILVVDIPTCYGMFLS